MRGLDFAIESLAGAMRVTVAATVTDRPLVVVGPNGAGKSSLLLALLGLRPARGHLRLDDDVLIDDRTGVALPPEARHLGYVPQDLGLFPHLTVVDNVAFGPRCRHPGRSLAADRAHARQWLVEMDVAHLAERRPQSLSGGERQRVALARALAGQPRALLLDEPLASLDARARRAARALISAQITARALPTIVVTHDAEDVRAFGGEVLVLESGQVVERGSAAVLESGSVTPFTKTLFQRDLS